MSHRKWKDGLDGPQWPVQLIQPIVPFPLSSDRPNLAPARASAELFGRGSFGGDVTEAEAYLFTVLDTFAVLFVQFFNFFL